MTTQQEIQATIVALSEYKKQEEEMGLQSGAVTNKTYQQILVEFESPSMPPDVKMNFTTYIGGKKHSFEFKTEKSKTEFYTALATFLQSLQATVATEKAALVTKLKELTAKLEA